MPRITEMYRYPVKGLSAEPLQRTTLEMGGVIPFDRAYAIENGPAGFDPAEPKWISKIKFLMLMRQEKLAQLQTEFDERTQTLTIRREGIALVSGQLDTEHGRQLIEAFFAGFSAEDLKGPPKILWAPGYSFQDTSGGMVVSLINIATVRNIAEKMAASVHHLRFRANLYVEGMEAWDEFNWVGKAVVAGGVTFVVTKRIDRCVAVNVDPFTGARDLDIPNSLRRDFDHIDCGVYLRVIVPGTLSVGDTIERVAG